MGRRNVVRPRPGPGRTDCPVANTGPCLVLGYENISPGAGTCTGPGISSTDLESLAGSS